MAPNLTDAEASVSPLQVLGLLVWALIADTPYHLYPAYGWVMFVAVFLWLVTIVVFVIYLFQLHMKLHMVPWPLVVSLGGDTGGGSRPGPLPLGVAVTVTFPKWDVAGWDWLQSSLAPAGLQGWVGRG